MSGHEVEQLRREQRIDGPLLLRGSSLQRSDFETRRRTDSSVSRSSSGIASATSAPSASSTAACDRMSIPKATISDHGIVMPPLASSRAARA
jgi:hypothetical protein